MTLPPCVLAGEVQRAAQPGGDLREDCGGAGARGHQAHEVHVLPGQQEAFMTDVRMSPASS